MKELCNIFAMVLTLASLTVNAPIQSTNYTYENEQTMKECFIEVATYPLRSTVQTLENCEQIALKTILPNSNT